MSRVLHILLALAIAGPGCLCPLLHALNSDRHHHGDESETPLTCFAASGCQHDHVVCDHEHSDTPRLKTPASNSLDHSAPGAMLAAISLKSEIPFARPGNALRRYRGPPPTAGTAGRDARILFRSFLV